jgi:nodulation protein F
MAEVADEIIDILKKNMRESPQSVSPETLISDLGIESLDFAVIVFDIEDTFGIEIPYNANEEVEDFATVGSIANKVEELIAKSRVAA